MTNSDFETWYYTDEHGLPFEEALLRFPELIEHCKSAIEYCSSQGWDVADFGIAEDGQIVMSNYTIILEPRVPATDVKELATQLFELTEILDYATGEKILG